MIATDLEMGPVELEYRAAIVEQAAAQAAFDDAVRRVEELEAQLRSSPPGAETPDEALQNLRSVMEGRPIPARRDELRELQAQHVEARRNLAALRAGVPFLAQRVAHLRDKATAERLQQPDAASVIREMDKCLQRLTEADAALCAFMRQLAVKGFATFPHEASASLAFASALGEMKTMAELWRERARYFVRSL
ncbi:MAG: hypothetical protein JNL34_00140 [Anaerolineae bacterium]|nr:hypothetical protein [Anaerolineae bacterium]